MKTKKIFKWTRTALFILGMGMQARAAFKDPLWSARVAALGGAATAMDTGASSAFYNPSAAITDPSHEAHFTYAKLFAGVDNVDLSLNELGYFHPLGKGDVLSVGWGAVVASDLRREDTVALGMAHLFRDLRWVGDVSAGVTFRYLSQTYTLDERTSNDPTFQGGRTKRNLALDLHGFLPVVPSLPELAVGFSLRSINRPNVGYLESDRLPLELALGGVYKWQNYSFPLDFVFRDGDFTPQLGVEGNYFQDRLAVRLGSDTDQVGAGVGYKTDWVGQSLLFDYTFLWPLNLSDSSGSHRVTLGVRF